MARAPHICCALLLLAYPHPGTCVVRDNKKDRALQPHWQYAYEESMQVAATVSLAQSFASAGTLRAWNMGEQRGSIDYALEHPKSKVPLFMMLVFGRAHDVIDFDFVTKDGKTYKAKDAHVEFVPNADAGTIDAPLSFVLQDDTI